MTGIEAGKAYVKFLLDDKDLKKSLAKVGDKLQSIGKIGSAATAPIIGAFAAATTAALNYGDGIGDMAARTGIAAKELSALQFAAEQSDVSVTALERGIKKMTVNIGNAINGTGTFATTLQSLNVSVAELQGLSADQQFLKISDAIARIEDPAMRAALAQKVFGGASRELLPLLAQGASGIQTLMVKAEELGVTLTEKDVAALGELDQALKTAKAQMFGFAVQIGTAISGDLTEFLKWTQEVGTKVINFAKNNRELVVTVAKITTVVAAASTAIVALGAVMTALMAHPVLLFLAAVAAAYLVIDEALKHVNKALGTQLKTLEVMFPQLAILKDAAEWAGLLNTELTAESTAPLAIEKQSQEIASRIQASVDAVGVNVAQPIASEASAAMSQQVQQVNNHMDEGIWRMVEILTRIERKEGGLVASFN